MSRQESEKQLIQAVEKLLVNGKKIGINAVSEEAKLNKVLIYRYFESLDGLLNVFAEKLNLWGEIRKKLELEIMEGRVETAREAAELVFHLYRKKLENDPVYLAIFRTEMNEHNPLTRRLEKERESESLAIAAVLEKNFPEEFSKGDSFAMGSLAIAAVTYLMLKGQDTEYYGGIPLQTEEGWHQIEELVNRILS